MVWISVVPTPLPLNKSQRESAVGHLSHHTFFQPAAVLIVEATKNDKEIIQ